MLCFIARFFRAVVLLFHALVRLLRSPFIPHPCTNCSKCAHFTDEQLFLWMKERAHLIDYPHQVLSKNIVNKPITCSRCGCARQQHQHLAKKLLTFDMLPNGGIVLVEHQQRQNILNRRKRFAAHLDPTHNHAQLTFQDMRVGHGPAVQSGAQILVHYDAYKRSTMLKFESTRQDAPLQLTLGQGTVIPAFDRALVGAKVASVRRLSVPSHLAFGLREIDGEREVDVVFDVEILALLSS
ncbi:FK506-binding protein [Gracilariopsis chorda]|uniref:peptidylprolyl isomerase n=1 Tax=Gracilariopsis chorda TaxID=448386 RepID=A0A2V3IYR7_9FLOR|nr:FK506-binding protein [Gracilariopsis chorda]|eukprot:PXF47288.1 FK506-binding protein [Gracilariopsis chorda]